MKLIIKNDSKETVKNPNVKIIETTEASFTNQTVFIEENDVPIIKYTDTEAMYFVKDLDNLYDRKSRSEVLLDITIDNLELIGSGSSEPVDSRPYKVYTALLTQTGTNAPVATVLENTLGVTITLHYAAPGQYFLTADTPIFINPFFSTGITNANQSLAIFEAGTGGLGINMKVGGVLANDVLFNHPIEIRVYN